MQGVLKEGKFNWQVNLNLVCKFHIQQRLEKLVEYNWIMISEITQNLTYIFYWIDIELIMTIDD